MADAGPFFPLFLLPLVVCLLTGCVNDPAEVAELQRKYTADVEVAHGVRMVYSDSAKIRVIVTAPTMLNYVDNADQRQEFPDGMHLTFFDEFQDTSSTLIAKWGVYRQRKNEITVRDSVVWESVDEQRLETEELNWEEKSARIYTNKFVILRQPDYLITGHGLEADQNFENATVLEVDGRIPMSRPRQ
ncbi:LPS export ABC transporter periplasmic protein LptC [Neolewinella antarctica]|uniref:LPS export ABC transporter protein LptC n=1 Tax=Neolewinella antarctica TaxID=442734 RepID=A0ABX0XA92_9BACT|nr:LPS export ABC transporter periplasmic protein LptC [Neolewinella antarctica]NJC26168.1 LPS export ABC transporter protein LptC [Neolewinella antarctica]